MSNGFSDRLADPVSDSINDLNSIITSATEHLVSRQADDGHWAYELEADATITAEYIMLNHFLGEPEDRTEQKLANYLKRIQGTHGGWPLYHDGEFNISASVKAYFALKLVGEDINAPFMKQARDAILAHGGGASCNVFTRISLALFGLMPWRAVPVTRIEIVFAPSWFPLHIGKVSYWTRTVTVPLLILTALRPQAKNPRGVKIDELFIASADKDAFKLENPTGHWLGSVMLLLDRMARPFERLIPKFITNMAIKKALDFIIERLNGEDGLGGIFPAIVNSIMVLDALNYPKDDPKVVIARKALDNLLVLDEDEGYCQPCLSPVWDTGLAAHAILETSLNGTPESVKKACDWLLDRQILDVIGDWKSRRPNVRPGGWAFQYRNDFYPDVDDAAVVAMALHRTDPDKYIDSIQRAAEWIFGMQSKNGGWAAFDADNQHFILENMPFADHGALLDPPTSDVTARCVSLLAQIGYDKNHPAVKRGVDYLIGEQESDGSWFGRWGTNYIYGAWSVLCALNAIGEEPDAPHIRRAVEWLISEQRADGGWGEDCATYWTGEKGNLDQSLPAQTAWALMALMAAGEVDNDAVTRGINYLLSSHSLADGWIEHHYNAVGFPKVFFLRYHGYRWYFPLMALARYRNMKENNLKRPAHGM